MSEMQFCRLVEHNDHEGETWTFWLQLDGNEDELVKLHGLLDAEAATSEIHDFPYELIISEWEPESVVDKLVEYADDGYMASHNKVVGTFTCLKSGLGDDAEDLYKGGICHLFRAVAA